MMTLSSSALSLPAEAVSAQAVSAQGCAPERTATANIAVWVLIWAELSEFALFFIVYLVVRAHHPQLFTDGPPRLNTLAGTLNTLVLLTSSYCVARAMAAIRRGKADSCLKWLGGTLLMGLSYCTIKAWEYQWNGAQGIDSRSDLFFTLYYYLTFNHLLHVLVGMCTIGWAMLRTRQGAFTQQQHEGLEGAACYWHMVDLAWIIIFPLLYVLG